MGGVSHLFNGSAHFLVLWDRSMKNNVPICKVMKYSCGVAVIDGSVAVYIEGGFYVFNLPVCMVSVPFPLQFHVKFSPQVVSTAVI